MSIWGTVKSWYGLGAIACFLVGAISTAVLDDQVAKLLHRPPNLTYEVAETVFFRNAKAKIDGKSLQVLLDNEPVANFAIAKVRLKNNGGSGIDATKYQGPIEFLMKNVSKIHYADAGNGRPLALKPVIRTEGNSIFLQPITLNKGNVLIINAGVEVTSVDQLVTMEAQGVILDVALQPRAVSEKRKKEQNKLRSNIIIAFVIFLVGAAWWYTRKKWKAKFDKLSRKRMRAKTPNTSR